VLWHEEGQERRERGHSEEVVGAGPVLGVGKLRACELEQAKRTHWEGKDLAGKLHLLSVQLLALRSINEEHERDGGRGGGGRGMQVGRRQGEGKLWSEAQLQTALRGGAQR
jgi:hypothetical protein